MRSCWVSLCGVLAVVCSVHTTYTHYSAARCDCNGRSRYCLRDAWGLHCVDCQGNTEGRRCERCRAGFHLQGAEPRCTPCRCHLTGSVGVACDSRGHCSCKDGVSGPKCDRCPDGAIGPNGCTPSRQPRENSGSPACFCYGHSSRCSAASGYSAHSITSTFTDGPDGWRAATAQGVTPDDVHFRWSPKYQDVEVISRNSLPVYLYAPAPYLGNQLLSYGQNFSFSLRLDRGVRHPSTSDVVVEGGGGQRVSASLGDLRSIVPCGQKIKYSFRLDERPGSSWTPQLSSSQFQTLLQNLTAIKIRSTFGDGGRGYLDNVKLASARRGAGVPAGWVQTCSCPPGYEGDFCERCSAGFRRRRPADGAFGGCEPCSCRGGGCDPQTGDCYSADETPGEPGEPGEPGCSPGFYRDPWRPGGCLRCPCPDRGSCTLNAISLTPKCDRCPPGTTGPRCDVCQEGFFAGPSRGDGVPPPCAPCRCNGHIDVSVAGSCDGSSGECLKCVNNTRGASCEDCLSGFYHGAPTDACKPCNCDPQGSESTQCDDSGLCRCRPGFEGLKCQRSNCPACFSRIKKKMETFAVRLQQLEEMSNTDGGVKPADGGELEAALRAAEELVDELQYDTELIAGTEKKLQGRLSAISGGQLSEERDLQNVADAAAAIGRRQQTYETKAAELQSLLTDMKRKLDEATAALRSAEVPLGDAAQGPKDLLSSLVQAATSLADQHQTKADSVERSANDALSDSEKSLALTRSLLNRENRVKELIGELKTMYDKTSAQVKGLESQAARLSGEAKDESKMSDGMLKDVANLEKNLPSPLKTDALVSRLDDVKKAADEDIASLDALQDGVQRDKTAIEDLLARGKDAQQDADKLLDRVYKAKADTEEALRRKDNSTELDDVLNTLRGFDQQIDSSKAQADAAIARLPLIFSTIKEAIRNNDQTKSLLDDVSGDFNDALSSVNELENLLDGLEGALKSLPPHADLLDEAAKLHKDAVDLKPEAQTAAADVADQLDKGKELEADAKEAADGATDALKKARETRDAVGQTLRDINNLLANLNQAGAPVDEDQVKQLEDSLDDARSQVLGRLKPWIQDVADREEAHRRRLHGLNRDIDAVLRDIANLEDILKAVPSGCYNSPPIEEA